MAGFQNTTAQALIKSKTYIFYYLQNGCTSVKDGAKCYLIIIPPLLIKRQTWCDRTRQILLTQLDSKEAPCPKFSKLVQHQRWRQMSCIHGQFLYCGGKFHMWTLWMNLFHMAAMTRFRDNCGTTNLSFIALWEPPDARNYSVVRTLPMHSYYFNSSWVQFSIEFQKNGPGQLKSDYKIL